MRHKKWKEMSSEIFLHTPFFTIYNKSFLPSNNLAINDYYLIGKPKSVHIIPFIDKQNVLLIKHYRPGPDKAVIEIPAGFVEKGETLRIACQRELIEETGYRADNFWEICNLTQDTSRYIGYPLHFFVAWGLTKNKKRKLSFEEREIEILEISLEKSIQMINKGEIKDMATVIGLLLVNSLSLKRIFNFPKREL